MFGLQTTDKFSGILFAVTRRYILARFSLTAAQLRHLRGIMWQFVADELRSVERTNVPEPIAVGGQAKVHLLDGLAHDFRYAVRTLKKSPGFAAMAMLVIALGIGANTAIFTVVNGVLLQPLPFPHPSQLVNIVETTAQYTHSSGRRSSEPTQISWARTSL